MNDKKREEVITNMVELREQLREQLSENNQEIENIGYYRDFNFKGTKFGINEAYIVKIKDDSIPEKEVKHREDDEKEGFTYEIYDKDNNLVATVDLDGVVKFEPEYFEGMDDRDLEFLELENAEFELPEELERDDMVLLREEIEENKTKREKDGAVKEKEQNGEEKQQQEDNSEEKEIAEKKGIPLNNVLFLRPDSNFYKDHPEIEKNLYFYRDNDGIVRAEYLDENGEPQPSNYFEESTTAIREQTVDMGDDGVPVVKQTPYQTMQTKNLNNVDKDIRGVRVNINIDQYGYMEISEARQGTNGMWSSHDIEVKGRDYNSYAMNKMTSIETRRADPNKLTEGYKAVEGTRAAEDGVEISEMFLMQHAEAFIDKFIDEGYNRDEAIKIFDLMIGEEKLTEEQAKEEVNNRIQDKSKDEREQEEKEQEEDEGRTPWGDVEAREARMRR